MQYCVSPRHGCRSIYWTLLGFLTDRDTANVEVSHCLLRTDGVTCQCEVEAQYPGHGTVSSEFTSISSTESVQIADDTICDVISPVVARLQTQHSNTFMAISGDLNHISFSAAFPTFQQFVNGLTRGNKTLYLFHENRRDAETLRMRRFSQEAKETLKGCSMRAGRLECTL